MRKSKGAGAQSRRSSRRATSISDGIHRAEALLGSPKSRQPSRIKVRISDGESAIVTLKGTAIQKAQQSIRTIPQSTQPAHWGLHSRKQAATVQKSKVPAPSPVSSEGNELEASEISKAFKKGFQGLVGGPLGNIQFNLRKMQQSLNRMDKKLARLTA